MTRYTLHVPERLNDGDAVSERIFALVEGRLLGVAGGFTLTVGQGGWLDQYGNILREPMRIYDVDTDDPEASGKLHELAKIVRGALAQEAVYLTHQEIGVSLVTQ